MRASGVTAVVVDIEGTTSATSFVYDRLFPYSRSRFADYLADPRLPALVERVGEQAGHPVDDQEAVALLAGWVDADAKVTVRSEEHTSELQSH